MAFLDKKTNLQKIFSSKCCYFALEKQWFRKLVLFTYIPWRTPGCWIFLNKLSEKFWKVSVFILTFNVYSTYLCRCEKVSFTFVDSREIHWLTGSPLVLWLSGFLDHWIFSSIDFWLPDSVGLRLWLCTLWLCWWQVSRPDWKYHFLLEQTLLRLLLFSWILLAPTDCTVPRSLCLYFSAHCTPTQVIEPDFTLVQLSLLTLFHNLWVIQLLLRCQQKSDAQTFLKLVHTIYLDSFQQTLNSQKLLCLFYNKHNFFVMIA